MTTTVSLVEAVGKLQQAGHRSARELPAKTPSRAIRRHQRCVRFGH
jgi:hypothetical protein